MVFTRTDLDEIKKVIGDEVRKIFNDQLKARLIDSITQKIEDKFRDKLQHMETDINEMKTELMAIKRENHNLKNILDKSEQHSRGRNIRIFGLDETDNEDLSQSVLQLFTNKMQINSVNISHLNKCYRIAAKKQSSDRPRAILVEFSSVNIRSEVLKGRKSLKNTKISVKEDLTHGRLKLLNAAVTKFSSKSAWCLHGNVYVKSEGVVHRVHSDEDIQRLKL